MQSIIISIYPAVRFPLWLATLLSKLSGLHICRCDWSRAWTWIGQLEAANDAPLGRAPEKVHETLAMLPIDGRIDGVTTPGMTLCVGRYLFIIHKQEVALACSMCYICGKVVKNPT